jgi:hypothetical protein
MQNLLEAGAAMTKDMRDSTGSDIPHSIRKSGAWVIFHTVPVTPRLQLNGIIKIEQEMQLIVNTTVQF